MFKKIVFIAISILYDIKYSLFVVKYEKMTNVVMTTLSKSPACAYLILITYAISHVHDLHVTSCLLKQEMLVTQHSQLFYSSLLIKRRNGISKNGKFSSEEERRVIMHFLIAEGDHADWHFKIYHRIVVAHKGFMENKINANRHDAFSDWKTYQTLYFIK